MEEQLNEKIFFKNIPKIEYNPMASVDEVLVFRHYNPEEQILGKPMKEWLRFSVCFWHTFVWQGNDIFGQTTFTRPWNQGKDDMEKSKNRIYAAFEFFSKLGVGYWTFHDRDIAPEGNSLEETNKNLDEIVEIALKLQKENNIKLLWGTSNLFSNPRYMNGAGTNPEIHSFAYAGAQVKKMLEVTNLLKGENFVFWGGREGYQSSLNTDVKKELDHMAILLKMANDYAEKIKFTGQLLIEPKPKEPMKHQYDYDAQTVMGFLKIYGLDSKYKLNIEPNHTTLAGHSFEHDILFASKFKMLGSIDLNTGDSSLGWDTDNFLMDKKNAVLLMKIIIEQGGLLSGGLNFDCKVRRESIDLEDLFIAHIGAMDLMALALKDAAKIIEDGILSSMLKSRYISFDCSLGLKIESGESTLEECEEFIKINGEVINKSGKQEKFDLILNNYLK